MSAFLTLDGGVELSREEAETLLAVKSSEAWKLLLRVISDEISVLTSRAMTGDLPKIEIFYESRGRCSALTKFIGFVETEIHQKVFSAIEAIETNKSNQAT